MEFSGIDIVKSNLFWKDYDQFEKLQKNCDYINLENYNKLKNILLNEKINFTFSNCNIKNYSFFKKYDYIFLSNISQYLNLIYNDFYLNNFNELIIKLSTYLNQNGILFHSYLYDFTYYSKLSSSNIITRNNPIYDVEKAKEILENLEIIILDSEKKYKDAVYVYIKK